MKKKLTNKQADKLSVELGNETVTILHEAAIKINKILNKYGMIAKLAIEIQQDANIAKNDNLKESTGN